jgi:hypothetical protein
MRASLTIERNKNPGVSLRNKLDKLIKYRCHPLTLDTNINSLETVYLNVYQAFLFIAMKFHLLAKNLPQSAEKNPSFFAGIFVYNILISEDTILRTIDFMNSAIKQATNSESALEMECNCPLSAIEVKWFIIFFKLIIIGWDSRDFM